jgi:hypothetical protein
VTLKTQATAAMIAGLGLATAAVFCASSRRPVLAVAAAGGAAGAWWWGQRAMFAAAVESMPMPPIDPHFLDTLDSLR